MEEEEMIKLLAEKAPIKEIYKDLFQPGFRQVGEALETVLGGANLILLPLKLINSKSRVYFQNNMKRYSEKLEMNTTLTPRQVPQYVGLPIIDKLTYLDQNELSETFINLLTKASFDETLKFVHPAYITILNNLSSDEAKILFHYQSSERIPIIDIYIHRFVENIKKPDSFGEEGRKTREQMKALIKYNGQDREDAYIKAAWNLSGIEVEVKLDFPENIDIYIENLEQNGLISFERNTYNNSDNIVYKNLIENIYQEQISEINQSRLDFENKGFNVEYQIRKAYIEFTTLGNGFLKACINELE